MIQGSIDKESIILSQIEKLNDAFSIPNDMSKQDIVTAIKTLNFTYDDFKSFLPHQPSFNGPYQVFDCFSQKGLEVLLTVWNPNNCCWPHDHGGGFGYVQVLRGTLCEEIYTQLGPQLFPQLQRIQYYNPGEMVFVNSQLIHTMSSVHKKQLLVGLHFYFSVETWARIYDGDSRKVYTVKRGQRADKPDITNIIHSSQLN